jgi:hypothetical protein
MKKFIFSLLMAFMAVVGMNAQTAVQTSKVLDNTYVGVTVGVTTPLDFNSVFPINTVAGLKFGKEFTPILGFEVEGVAIFNDNHWNGPKTFVKATNVGLNGIVNLSNLFAGYNGTPRTVEFKTNTGLGWLHVWNESSNAFTAKTGVDVQFNLGKTKAHSIVLTPAVYWNLNKFNEIRFDKRGAQLGVAVSYIYHFKTSNGTRHFKTYDVGAMLSEIDRLNTELAKKPTEVVREVVKTVAAPTTNAIASVKNDIINPYVVSFAQGSYILTDAAKTVLDGITAGATVTIDATASPEGTEAFNLELSKNRANAVADYLKTRGVNVDSANGLGVTGNDSQRVARILFK